MTSLKKQIGDKKAVALVGMAQTSRHLAPWNVPNCEIWVLNESHAHNYIKRIDRIYQMHPKWDYMRANNFNDPLYPEFLKNLPWIDEDIERLESLNTYKKLPRGFPDIKTGNKRRSEDINIVLLKPDEDIPGEQSVYPFKEIMDSYNNNKQVRYFTSSAPYMIALALHEGYEWIGVFGFEMSSSEEYAYQKPCMEFWLGMAMARLGADNVYLPPGCRLLGETTQLYGYDKVPGFTGMHAEIRKNALNRERRKAETEFNAVTGRMRQIQNDYKVAVQKKDTNWMKKLESQLGNIQRDREVKLARLNALHGAWVEADRVWKEINNLPSVEEVKPIIPSA